MMLKDTLERARRLAIDDESLHRALRAWHMTDAKRMAPSRFTAFGEWLDNMIEYMSGQIAKWYDGVNPPAEDVVCALRVNAEGDFLAEYLEEKTTRFCITDANCYVEDGIVYSNVWMRSEYREMTYDKANEVSRQFRSVGYLEEVRVEEEDAREATVCAQIDFPEYKAMARSGSSAESIFMYAPKCDTISCMKTEEKSVAERVKEAIANAMSIDVSRVSDNASFIEDLGADDLDEVEIVIALEDEFEIAIPEDDALRITSVWQAVEYVEKSLNEKK